jgi:hypothetical protein
MSRCLLTIQEDSSETSAWLMGDPFLRKYYSIYDMDEMKIGLIGVPPSTRDYFPNKGAVIIQELEEVVDEVLEVFGIEEEDEFIFWVIVGVVTLVTICCLI